MCRFPKIEKSAKSLLPKMKAYKKMNFWHMKEVYKKLWKYLHFFAPDKFVSNW